LSGITPILDELLDGSKPVRVASLAGLTGLDREEQAEFREAWGRVGVERRRDVIHDLIEMAEDNVELDFDAVYFVTLDDADPSVRQDAIHGLWEYEARDLIAPLIRLMDDDPDVDVRASAAIGLGRYVMLAEFERISDRDRDRVVGALRSAFGMQSNPLLVRARALEAVGAHGEPWVAGVIRAALASGEPRLEVSALHAMGRSAEPQWLPTLLACADDPDAEVRYEVALALGEIGDQEALSGLMPLLEDGDVEVQEAAIDALGKVGGPRATEVLKELIGGDDARVRQAAQEALAESELANDSFFPGV